MKALSPRAIERAMADAMQALATIDNVDDQRLLLGTVEGQSDVLEVIDRLAEQTIADKKLGELASERARRLDARADRTRAIMLQMLETLGLKSLERPLFTASVSHHAKAFVTSAELVPAEYTRTAVDMIALRRALMDGTQVPGASLGNPTPRLTLRTA